MSLQIITGVSGAGKTTYVINKIISDATESPNKQFFYIVPDQFTMQTQADIVRATEAKGIMNIDVLSFSRLAHRIFEETGEGKLPIIDDTGKNLIVRRCVAELQNQLTTISANINRPGFVHELKSVISELMQYDIDEEGINRLISYCDEHQKRELGRKLKDIALVYSSFKTAIKERYTTSEERMTVLARAINKSRLCDGAVVVLDGFTGFTPIQNQVLRALCGVCDKIYVTLTYDNAELFAFTGKSKDSLIRIASETGTELLDDIVIQGGKKNSSVELRFVEENLYRYPSLFYEKEPNNIVISRCFSVREEVRKLVSDIQKLVKINDTLYRDLAVACGNLDSYKKEIEQQLSEHNIPVFIDESKKIVLNPFVEFVKASIALFIKDFSYEGVIQFLKTGFTGIEIDDCDFFEEYIRLTGYKGQSQYLRSFTRIPSNLAKDPEAAAVYLSRANSIRQRILECLEPYTQKKLKKTATLTGKEFATACYEFFKRADSYRKLIKLSEDFKAADNLTLAKEYEQIYASTCHLLEQIYDLIGDDKMTIKEFYEILDSGFQEIKVGVLPAGVDRIIVGDCERTRLKTVKYLFFVGMNDCYIPKMGGKGGIISDIEREFLTESGEELSPSPRQQMYISRFYLYNMLTKPLNGLYMSYMSVDSAGKGARPSSVIADIHSLFPKLREDNTYSTPDIPIESVSDAREAFAIGVRRLSSGELNEESRFKLLSIGSVLQDEKKYVETIINNAFKRYEGTNLDSVIAGLLYGGTMLSSISRVEKYASCAYSFFLQYGLGLQPKEEYGADAITLGNIYHGVLEKFAKALEGRGLSWLDFAKEDAEEIIGKAVEEEALDAAGDYFFETATGRYALERMKSVLITTVTSLSTQLQGGAFVPTGFEVKFDRTIDLGLDNPATKLPEKLHITGKIDRTDISEQDGDILVKIIDYKSGKKAFSLGAFYRGAQLQMVVYMGEALREISTKRPDSNPIPAALLYYHIDEPLVTGGYKETDDEINSKIMKELRMKGVVNDDEAIIGSLDRKIDKESSVIPVKTDKSGSFSATADSVTLSTEDLMMLTKYAEHKLIEVGRKALSGDITMNPIEIRTSPSASPTVDSCSYCSYKHVCGFESRIPGYEKSLYVGDKDEDILGKIREEMSHTDKKEVESNE